MRTTYDLSPEYRALFDQVLAYARETIIDPARRRHSIASASAGGPRSACCARSLEPCGRGRDTSQPRHRHRDATVEEADEIGRRTVLDLTDDESAERHGHRAGRRHRGRATTASSRTTAAAASRSPREADALAGDSDAKLQDATSSSRSSSRRLQPDRLLPLHRYRRLRRRGTPQGASPAASGRRPSPACSTRPSARSASPTLGEAEPSACSSPPTACRGHQPPGALRRGRPLRPRLEPDPARAARGPRRPLRAEGDRGAGRSPTSARTIGIDGIVLDVLLRKHTAIRDSPRHLRPRAVDSNAVVEAILEGLVLRGRDEQLSSTSTLSEPSPISATSSTTSGSRPPSARSARARCSPRRRSRSTRSHTSSRRSATRSARASTSSASSPTRSAPRRAVVERTGRIGCELTSTSVLRGLRDPIGSAAVRAASRSRRRGVTYSSTHAPARRGARRLRRSTPRSTPTSSGSPHAAVRCARMQSSAERPCCSCVCGSTSTQSRAGTRELLAEEVSLLAFTGAPDDPDWLGADGGRKLLLAEPQRTSRPTSSANSRQPVSRRSTPSARVWTSSPKNAPRAVLATHRRIREVRTAPRHVRVRRAQTPVDVLGVYVFLPGLRD